MSSQAGEILGGRYQLAQPLATNRAVTIWLAVDHAIQAYVALKLMELDKSPTTAERDRFLDEMRLSSELAPHPHIVRTLGLVREPSRLGIVMEYVNGPSVKTELARLGRLPFFRAVTLIEQLLEALEHIHAQEIIHLDVKPDNMLLAAPSFLKLCDFGIAHALEPFVQPDTSLRRGSVAYMAPELLGEAQVAGAATDTYAAGVCFYEMLCGALPHPGTSPAEILARARAGKRSPLSGLVDDIPRSGDEFVSRALHPKANRRFSSAARMIEALQRIGATA